MFNETQILRTTLVLTLIFGSIGSIWRLPVGLSLFLGGGISILAFRLLILEATKILKVAQETEISRKQASKLNWKCFLKRCSLYSAALIISIINPYLRFLPTLLGLLLPRIAIIYHLLLGRIHRGT